MSTERLDCIEINPENPPVATIIWLHGLGADGHDFVPLVPELDIPRTMPLRFVFPHAPVRPVTLNGGMAMRAWYDIISLDRNGPVDAAGINESSALLESLIAREEQRGIDPGRIVLAGFSQGGAIAINTVLRAGRKLAGLMALSTYLPLPGEIDNSAGSRELPVFMAHGTFDPMLPIAWGKASADHLRAAGYTVEWHDYPMAHAVCPEEIRDIRNWLLSVYD
jgi:phospholipase/carboxylesterase